MPKAQGTIRVQPVAGEALRYLVESWSNPKLPYLVDLSENHGNGACTCKDFQTRRQVAIREGHPLFTRETSCRHLIAARKHFTIQTLTDCAALVKAQERAPRRTEQTSHANQARPAYSGYC